MQPESKPNQASAISVSELNRRARTLLEGQLNQQWIAGEISNFSRPASGHWYFTLKDSNAQIRCAMFRGRNSLLRQQPQSGDQVIVRGKVSLYEARGDYQLIAEHLQLAGEGLLQQQFEQLKQSLFEEGLFNPEHKQPLPTAAKRIAIISSASGAALHDILQVLKRRDPSLEVVLSPASVQGAEAPAELRQALARVQQLNDIDAIIIGRGGGSLEDLWAFNDEYLARQLFACPIPVISAVGHEVDFSISDFVADVRAPTPSAAAELISRDSSNDRYNLQRLDMRLRQSWARSFSYYNESLIQLRKRLKHPGEKIQQWQQRCDRAEDKLKQVIKRKLTQQQQNLERNQRLLQGLNPALNMANQGQQIKQLEKRLKSATQNSISLQQQRFAKLAAELDLVSPLATLNRGYSITKTEDDKILHSIGELNKDDLIKVQLSDGVARSKVLSTRKLQLRRNKH